MWWCSSSGGCRGQQQRRQRQLTHPRVLLPVPLQAVIECIHLEPAAVVVAVVGLVEPRPVGAVVGHVGGGHGGHALHPNVLNLKAGWGAGSAAQLSNGGFGFERFERRVQSRAAALLARNVLQRSWATSCRHRAGASQASRLPSPARPSTHRAAGVVFSQHRGQRRLGTIVDHVNLAHPQAQVVLHPLGQVGPLVCGGQAAAKHQQAAGCGGCRRRRRWAGCRRRPSETEAFKLGGLDQAAMSAHFSR